MIHRLANVIYWLGCSAAVIAFALAALVYFSWGGSVPAHGWTWIVVYLGAGAGAWLLGRTVRYVLADR